MAKLLLIDEATMLDRFQLEALDRTLRDLMQKPDKPFGDKIIILAGDFRQCLPVVPGATRAGTVEHCINHSHLWKNTKGEKNGSWSARFAVISYHRALCALPTRTTHAEIRIARKRAQDKN